MLDETVAVATCKQYDINKIAAALNSGFSLLGGLNSFIKPSHTVLIKPDLYHACHPNLAKTTSPYIISALAELISKIGAKCIIADSPKGGFKQSRLDSAYVKTKMLEASNNGHATLNTNDKICIVTHPQGEQCRDIYIMDAINDADIIINVGKFRCDANLGLIGCSQNLFGLIPGYAKELVTSRCYKLIDYYNYNIDLFETLSNKVVLNVLDGMVTLESNNTPRILNSILIGANPYAVDSVALTLINENPKDSFILQEASRRGHFNFETTVLGDNVELLTCSDYCYTQPNKYIKPHSQSHFKRVYNSTQKRPVINAKNCKGCKACVNICPMKAISTQSSSLGEHSKINYNRCIGCFKCLQNCPYQIIETKQPRKHKRINRHLQRGLNKD